MQSSDRADFCAFFWLSIKLIFFLVGQQIKHLTELCSLPFARFEVHESMRLQEKEREHTIRQREALIDDLYRQLEASKSLAGA